MPEKITRRQIAALAAALVFSAAVLFAETYLWQNRQYYLSSVILLILATAMFFARFERRRPQVREIVILAVMTALAVAGRAAFYWAPQFKPVCAIVILTAVAFNAEAGFVTGAAAGLISNFFFGQGPWTPWQMVSFGLVGYLAGLLFHGTEPKRTPLLIYGFFSVLIIYGLVMDTANVLMYSRTVSWQLLLASYASGFAFNLIHAFATAVFLLLLREPVLSKLSRIKTKYGILE